MATVLQTNPNEQEAKDLTQISTNATGGPSAVPQQQANQQAAAPARQGSNRFTNIQNFMDANQGGGQRIAQAVTGRVGERLDEKEATATTQAQKIGQTIQDTDNKVRTASSAYSNRFSDPTFVAGDFVSGTPTQAVGTAAPVQTSGIETPPLVDGSDMALQPPIPNQTSGTPPAGMQYDPSFGGFVDLMSGKYIDQTGITRDLTAAQASTLSAGTEANLLSEALATEEGGALGGRFGLLRDTFGRQAQSYNSGMQRLDQALLQGQAPDALTGLQQSVGARATSLDDLGSALEGGNTRFQDLLGFQEQSQRDLGAQTAALLGSGQRTVETDTAALAESFQRQGGQDKTDVDAALAFIRNEEVLDEESLARGLALLNIGDDFRTFGGQGIANLGATNLGSDFMGSQSAADFVSADQAANLNALQQLSTLQLDPAALQNASRAGNLTADSRRFNINDGASDNLSKMLESGFFDKFGNTVVGGGFKPGGGGHQAYVQNTLRNALTDGSGLTGYERNVANNMTPVEKLLEMAANKKAPIDYLNAGRAGMPSPPTEEEMVKRRATMTGNINAAVADFEKNLANQRAETGFDQTIGQRRAPK